MFSLKEKKPLNYVHLQQQQQQGCCPTKMLGPTFVYSFVYYLGLTMFLCQCRRQREAFFTFFLFWIFGGYEISFMHWSVQIRCLPFGCSCFFYWYVAFLASFSLLMCCVCWNAAIFLNSLGIVSLGVPSPFCAKV